MYSTSAAAVGIPDIDPAIPKQAILFNLLISDLLVCSLVLGHHTRAAQVNLMQHFWFQSPQFPKGASSGPRGPEGLFHYSIQCNSKVHDFCGQL